MKRILILVSLALGASNALAEEDYWVTVDRLNKRTCSENSCGVLGQLFFREKVTVKERHNGWARITKYYDASCRGGKSEYVDAGRANCIESNGIVNGKVAQWVSMKYLSQTRPADPGANAKGYAKAVSSSDDYRIYKNAFANAAKELVTSKRCSIDEIKSQGGFYKSTKYKSQPIYFIYCGGYNLKNKIHLNAKTGEVY